MRRWLWLLVFAGLTAPAAFWLSTRWGAPDRKSAPDRMAPDRQSADIVPAAAPQPVVRPRVRRGGLDVTFLVAADTHLGFDTPDRDAAAILASPLGIEKTNLLMIEHMNGIAGKPFPDAIGGHVGVPRGVLLAGDLTEDGGRVDWQMFEALYGDGGPLRFPVYEADGNHDRNRDWFVREAIARRHGGRYYSFDFDDLHLVCLAEAPDDEGLSFLQQDLRKLSPDVPVVVYFHYPLAGAFAENNWFGRGSYRDRLAQTLNGHHVVAIFHGHRHSSGHYQWRGHDVYNVGSPKHGWRSFAVVHVTDDQLTVASWNYELGGFWWWHRKPIEAFDPTKPRVREVIGTSPLTKPGASPELDLF